MAEKQREIKRIIVSYLEALVHQGIRSEKAILFGSQARGTAEDDSDIDFLVISRDFAGLNLRARAEVLGWVAGRIMEPVEARGYTPEEVDLRRLSPASFLADVLSQAEVVTYEFNGV